MPGDITRAAMRRQSTLTGSAIGTPAAAAASRRGAASSQAWTRAPPARSACAAASPVRASPSTATSRPSYAVTGTIRSPQLQGSEARDREDRGDDPEPDDDGGLLPALLLEMMVQRRHAEDALARELVARNLHDHGHGLQHEEAANDRQHDLVLGDDGDHAKRSADRERAGVAHEHHGGRRVEPEKPECRPDHRAAEDRELAGPRHVLDLQVVREVDV